MWDGCVGLTEGAVVAGGAVVTGGTDVIGGTEVTGGTVVVTGPVVCVGGTPVEFVEGAPVEPVGAELSSSGLPIF